MFFSLPFQKWNEVLTPLLPSLTILIFCYFTSEYKYLGTTFQLPKYKVCAYNSFAHCIYRPI